MIIAIFLLYLSPCLGFCSILVTASSGGVYVCGCYSCYSYCGCCKVAGAAIGVTSGAAIRTTYGVAVGIAGRIGGGSYGHYYRRYYRDFYRDSCGA